MKKLFTLLLLICALGAPAFAQDVPADSGAVAAPAAEAPAALPAEAPAPAVEAVPPTITEQGKGFYDAVKGGQWLLALGFFGMLFGAAFRWGLGRKWDFWKTKAGGYSTAVATGVALLGAGLVDNGGVFSMGLLATAVAAMFTAMGVIGPVKSLAKKATPAA